MRRQSFVWRMGYFATALAVLLGACAQAPQRPDVAADAPDDLEAARSLAYSAAHTRNERTRAEYWLRCAATAYAPMASPRSDVAGAAATLANRCTEGLLETVLRRSGPGFKPGPTRIAGVEVDVDFRRISHYFTKPAQLALAADVPADLFDGERHTTPGFGIPLTLLAPRCDDRPLCAHLPPEGVFRWATAWIENPPGAPMPRLVVADPIALGDVRVGDRRYPLAADTSAFYAHGASTSHLRRLGILGLIGGRELGRRAGLYLLEDYDPTKRPIVMIHGLGSNPLAWARLSNAIWGDAALRAHFQVWHMVYETNAPTLVLRHRLRGYLDATWQALDPEGDDPARRGVVLVGHSLGGVLSRLLCVDSGETLWSAAFDAPIGDFVGDEDDLRLADAVFHFSPYPGVTRAIFIASPHQGSPTADGFLGRFARSIVGQRAPEIDALRRLARENSGYVKADLRMLYQRGLLNSITTLQTAQPVRKAAQSLLPVGIPYHTIAGSLPGRDPPTDGFVPLASTQLPGAASTLVVESGHDVYENAAAVAEVLRILREDVGFSRPATSQPQPAHSFNR